MNAGTTCLACRSADLRSGLGYDEALHANARLGEVALVRCGRTNCRTLNRCVFQRGADGAPAWQAVAAITPKED
jgi:hypothetical protein